MRVVATGSGAVTTPVLSAGLVPVGLALNAGGSLLYAANASSNTIAMVQVGYNYAVSVLAGATESKDAAGFADGRAPTFNGPRGVAVTTDASGRPTDVVTVGDTGNNAIRVIYCGSFFSPTQTAAATAGATPTPAGTPTPTASFDVAALAAAAASAGLGTGGALAGGLVGALLLAAAAVVAFYVARRTRRRKAKALATVGQKQRERQLEDSQEKLKDEVAAARAEKAALEAQLAQARAAPAGGAGGGLSEDDVARALAAAGVAGNAGVMATLMAALQGRAGAAAEPASAAKKPVDALNAGFNPMAVRQQSLRSLSKQGFNTTQVAVASHGGLSRAASSQRPVAGAAVAEPNVANADFSRGSVARSNSSRAAHAPVTAAAAAQKKPASYLPVWSEDHKCVARAPTHARAPRVPFFTSPYTPPPPYHPSQRLLLRAQGDRSHGVGPRRP